MIKLTTKSIEGCNQARHCLVNCPKAAQLHGGKAVYGWQVSQTAGGYLEERVHHCAYQDRDGNLWELTPHFDPYAGGYALEPTLFLPDPTAKPVMLPGLKYGQALPTRYISKSSNPLARAAAECCNKSADCELNNDKSGALYWIDKADRYCRRLGLERDSVVYSNLVEQIKNSFVTAE